MKYPIISKVLSRSVLAGVVVVAVVFATSAAAQDESIPCAPESPTAMAISYGDTLNDFGGAGNCVIFPSVDIDTFQFLGNVGDMVRLTIAQPTGPFNTARLQVFDPTAALVTTIGPGRADITLPSTGLYTLVVYDNGSDDTFAYRLGLKLLFPPAGVPITYGDVQSSDVLPSVDVDQFVFNGTTGDAMRITLHPVSGPFNTARVDLIDPSGTIIQTMTPGSLDVALAATGLYSLIVYDNGSDDTFGYEMGLNCLFGACATAPPTCLIDLSLDGTTMNIDLLLATPEPATYQMYLYGNVGNILLLNSSIPAVPNATALPLSIAGFPNLGTIAMWSSIRTASGVRCFSFDAIDSSAVSSAFSSRRSNSPTADDKDLGDKLRQGLKSRSPDGKGKGLGK